MHRINSFKQTKIPKAQAGVVVSTVELSVITCVVKGLSDVPGALVVPSTGTLKYLCNQFRIIFVFFSCHVKLLKTFKIAVDVVSGLKEVFMISMSFTY